MAKFSIDKVNNAIEENLLAPTSGGILMRTGASTFIAAATSALTTAVVAVGYSIFKQDMSVIQPYFNGNVVMAAFTPTANAYVLYYLYSNRLNRTTYPEPSAKDNFKKSAKACAYFSAAITLASNGLAINSIENRKQKDDAFLLKQNMPVVAPAPVQTQKNIPTWHALIA